MLQGGFALSENRSGKQEFKLLARAGFRVSTKLGCEIYMGNRAGYGISILT